MPNAVMITILKTAKAPKEFIQAAGNMLCTSCVLTARKKQTTKVGPPRFNYSFNHEVGIDVFGLHDHDGHVHLFFNIVCFGTDFQVVHYLCLGPGIPLSMLCGTSFTE